MVKYSKNLWTTKQTKCPLGCKMDLQKVSANATRILLYEFLKGTLEVAPIPLAPLAVKLLHCQSARRSSDVHVLSSLSWPCHGSHRSSMPQSSPTLGPSCHCSNKGLRTFQSHCFSLVPALPGAGITVLHSLPPLTVQWVLSGLSAKASHWPFLKINADPPRRQSPHTLGTTRDRSLQQHHVSGPSWC